MEFDKVALRRMTVAGEMPDPNAYEGREFEAAAKLDNYYQWITDCFRPYLRGDGTEIGAGVGNYSQYLLPFFDTLDLLEPSSLQAPTLQEKFSADERVSIFSETIDSYATSCTPKSRDTICMINVLEHIEDDVAALKVLSGLLKKDGHLCIFVPALSFLYCKLDKIFGHHRRYSKSELQNVVEQSGFKILELRYMDMAGIFAWGLINTIGGSTSLNPRAIKIYDRFIIPVTRAAEKIVPAPLGKSLILIAQKVV